MCGILGILRNKGVVSNLLYDGLLVLQHRGQDAAGIVVCENERLYLRKDNGLVKDVFQKEQISELDMSDTLQQELLLQQKPNHYT